MRRLDALGHPDPVFRWNYQAPGFSRLANFSLNLASFGATTNRQ
jgi:hypothetical protein